MSKCPGCGEDHDTAAPMEHQKDMTAGCHRSALMPCPRYFSHLCQPALVAALPGYGSDTPGFLSAVAELNNEGYVTPAYYTWMALMGRYSMHDGVDRQKALRRNTRIKVPRGAPEYLHKVAKLVEYSSRAAILGDAETVVAAFKVAQELDSQPLMTVLLSAAASAHFNVEYNDACTSEHIQVYHLLGSQVDNANALQALPYLVDMVVGAMHDDMPATLKAFKTLVELPGVGQLVSGVSILGRVVGQMIAPDVTVLSTDGRPSENLEGITGILDVAHASAENTPREHMAGVWAIRVAQAFATAESEEDGTRALRDIIESHGDTAAFAMDVIMGGTQLLAYMLDKPEPEDP